MNEGSLRNFLELSYDELEELNLKAAHSSMDAQQASSYYRDYLEKESRIKAVTLCFSNLEGRLHMLDYDKKFFLKSYDSLTFDGSSIRGFSELHESDLRLSVDWQSIVWLPSDVFGAGKVILFANVLDRDGLPYAADFRAQLQSHTEELFKKDGVQAYMAAEIEGFLLEGVDAEQSYQDTEGFKLITSGGYYHSLPLDRLRRFIDAAAEAQRAMGFRNEKDHPEVAPSQFEINFSYAPILRACDRIQLYKLVCRQIANNQGMTATFLPKPVAGINGSGMHTNISLTKAGKNLFYDAKGQDGLSAAAWDFISRILNHAPELCLLLNSSVNAYRRLDPNFEAPNQIKVSANDRGSMVRIPLANSTTARLEVRSVAPDANPYLALYAVLRTGLEGEPLMPDKDKRPRLRFLPGTINDALRLFKASPFLATLLGESVQEKYAAYKQLSADRNPRELGATIKRSEIIYHHEVTNQSLWNSF